MILFIRYRIEKDKTEIFIRYKKCGREEALLKANEKIKEIKRQYDECGVVLIDKVNE
jgi:hypothetical protein